MLPSLGRDGLAFAVKRRMHGVPGQRCAFHPSGEAGDTGKYFKLSHRRVIAVVAILPRYHALEILKQLFRLSSGFALQSLRHHRSRSTRDSATRALKRDVLDHVSLDSERDGTAIAAQRIETLGFVVGSRQLAEVPGRLGVLQDHFLIDIPQIGH